MREIKFRAYDGKSMFSVKNLSFLADGDSYATGKGERDSTAVMQFTGLKDKSNRDIYEGDIIRICHYEAWDDSDPEDKPEYSIHEVKWGELAWVVNPTYSEEYNDLGMVGEGWEDGHLWMEVIGNIYENPELLEKPMD